MLSPIALGAPIHGLIGRHPPLGQQGQPPTPDLPQQRPQWWRGWPLSLMCISPSSSSELDGGSPEGTAGPGAQLQDLARWKVGTRSPGAYTTGRSRWGPGCLREGPPFWARPGNADMRKSLEQSFSPGQGGVPPEGKSWDPGLKLGNGGASRRLEGLDRRGRKATSRWEAPREAASLEEAGPGEGRREVRGQTRARDGGEGQASRPPEPGDHRVRGASGGGVGAAPCKDMNTIEMRQ